MPIETIFESSGRTMGFDPMAKEFVIQTSRAGKGKAVMEAEFRDKSPLAAYIAYSEHMQLRNIQNFVDNLCAKGINPETGGKYESQTSISGL